MSEKLSTAQQSVMALVDIDRMVPVRYRNTVNALVRKGLISLTGEETDGMIVCRKVLATPDRVEIAAQVNAELSMGDYVMVEVDGVRADVYRFTDATAVSVYLEILTGGQQVVDTAAFGAGLGSGLVWKLSPGEADALATELAERTGDWDRQAVIDDAYVAEHAPEGATVYSYGRSWWVESHKARGITLGDQMTGELITYPHSVMAAHLRGGRITHFPQPMGVLHDTRALAGDPTGGAPDAEEVRPFRTSGKVKNTRQARRFRRGA